MVSFPNPADGSEGVGLQTSGRAAERIVGDGAGFANNPDGSGLKGVSVVDAV